MTKQQLRRNSNAILREVTKEAKQKIWKLINSGAMEFHRDDMRDFSKAKLIVSVAIEKASPNAWGYNNWKKELDNLRKF